MKNDKHKQKNEEMIAGDGSSSEQGLEPRNIVNAPGWQASGPTLSTFDLDFHLGEKGGRRQDPHQEKGESEGAWRGGAIRHRVRLGKGWKG